MKGRLLLSSLAGLLLSGLVGCQTESGRVAAIGSDSRGNLVGVAAAKPDVDGLPIGGPCRVDLVRPMHKGAAYEGTVLRVTPDEIVLSHAVYEGPSKRPNVPILKDIPLLGERYFGNEQGIVRTNAGEARIARSEVAAVRVLDKFPEPVRREDW
jgi:hypothetical protein